MKSYILILLVCHLITFSSPVWANTQQPDVAQTAPAAANENVSLARNLQTMPVQKELGPQALETYAYLLFIQAIFDEDEAALLEAASLLKDSGAPTPVWLDGGVWLMSRKSPNSVPYLEEALKSQPEDMSLNLLYAEALGDHGMADRGVELMRAYLKKHPESLDARIEMALLLVKDKQFTEAQKLLAGITPKQRTPLVDYYQAKALIGMNKRAEAVPYLKKAVKGLPDFVDAIAELAFIYEQDGNYKEARANYDRLQKLHFSPQEVAMRQVGLSLKMRQPEKAVQYIKQGPDNLPFKIAAANMLMESRHYLQAEAILKQIAAKPDAPIEVYLLLADLVYEQRNNLKMAMEWLDKIPPQLPGQQKAWVLRCQLYAEAGKAAEALAMCDKAMKEFPDASEFADLHIRLLAKEKKAAEALQEARDAVKKWPDNPSLRFLLGSLLDENGQKKEALEVMEELAKKYPDNFQALNYIGFTLAEENRDLERALQLLNSANELSPNQSYIVDSLAWALFRSNRIDEALTEIRRAVNLGDVADAAIWEHYGDIASKAGKKDEAKRAYRKALEFKPENAAKVRAKLSTL